LTKTKASRYIHKKYVYCTKLWFLAVTLEKQKAFAAPPTLTTDQAEVVELLRRRPTLSRTALADRTGSSRAKMTMVVGDLIARGVVEEQGEGDSSGGRRPRILRFNPDFAYVVGVDMGATSLDVVLADFSGAQVARRAQTIDVREGPDIVLGCVRDLVLDMLNSASIPVEKLLTIGIGVPGPVEFSTGLLIAPPIMPGWEAYPIRQFLREYFPNAQVIVDNDVNVMVLGELRAGAGVNEENFFFVKVGTGIGSGIVVGGQVYRGSSGCAGDIGHICADRSGVVCHCGNIGCLEAMAAGPAIAARAIDAAQTKQSAVLEKMLRANNGVLTAKDVGAAAAAGDRTANEIIQESGRMIGEVLASLVNFFNPSLIIIGGGVSTIGHQFLASIRRGVLHRSLPLSTRHLRIDYSMIGSDAGVTGAVHLALDHVFDVQRG
jgi:glucokinase-like ROK family protein